jgi:sugar phosphate isomerase/epimerase
VSRLVTLAARAAVCENTLRQGAFAADDTLARAAGFAAIGVDAAAVDAVGVTEAARILTGEGLRASSYMTLPDLLDTGDGSDPGPMARGLDTAAALGAPVAVIMTGPLGSDSVANADARARDSLARTARLARDRGVRVALEPMHPIMRRWTYVHTLEHARGLVDGIDGAGIVLDLGHVWWERSLDDFVAADVELIASVQLTNISRSALDEVRYDRTQLDAGDVPIAAIVQQLEQHGYAGWYEHEVLARIPRHERLPFLRASHDWFAALS